MNIYELRKAVKAKIQEVIDDGGDQEMAHLHHDEAMDMIIDYHASVVGTRYMDVISELCKLIKEHKPGRWYA